jgi:hypothetical protein
MSQDSAVGIATGYGLDGRGVRVSHIVHTGSGAHPASYPMGTGGSFLSGKAAGAWGWSLTSNYRQGQEYMDLYIHSPIHLHGVVLN